MSETLYVVDKLFTRNRGRIELESEESKGSLFRIVLPGR